MANMVKTHVMLLSLVSICSNHIHISNNSTKCIDYINLRRGLAHVRVRCSHCFGRSLNVYYVYCYNL